jgi:hypothetical protein
MDATELLYERDEARKKLDDVQDLCWGIVEALETGGNVHPARAQLADEILEVIRNV